MLLLICDSGLFAQQRRPVRGLPPATNNDPFANEIQEVTFEGNSVFTDDDLLGIVESRVSLSPIQRFIRYYAEGVSRNPSVPPLLKRAFQRQLASIQGEIYFFNAKTASGDADAIKEFYSLNGYHYADVYFSFKPDSATGHRTLTFFIDEKKAATVDTIVYLGLDSLPRSIYDKIFSVHSVKEGDTYSEEAVQKDIIASYRILQDSGYYYSTYQQPKVSINSAELKDSVTILFSTGIRQKICNIFFIDSTEGQKGVAYNIRRGMLEFSEGEWFNRSALQKSINNLYELNTFDIVTIDTNSMQAPITDSCLSFAVSTKYRKLHEINAAPFVNRTAFDNFLNTGAEVSYTHRNLFGAADATTIFGRLQFLDVGNRGVRFFTDQSDWEYQLGLNYFHPFMGRWWKSRVSFSAPLTFSDRYILRPLRLLSWNVKPTFVFRPGWDFDLFGWFNLNSLTNLTLDATIEGQYPRNYTEAENEAYVQNRAVTREDTLAVREVLQIYRSLNDYKKAITGFILGAYPVADLRDNIFSPTQGHLFSFALEAAVPGLSFSQFTKLQGMWTSFWPWSKQLTFATKVRTGHIFWYGDRQNSYIPFERHFFAGGGNSIRGWASRELRDPDTGGRDTLSGDLAVLSQLVGSGTLIETSAEWRYRFPYYRSLGSTWASVVSSLGITGFLDVGNVYNRLTPTNYNKLTSFSQFWNGLAISPGLGLRYETPVGPLRIDFGTRLKDPNEGDQWFHFNKWQLHIGLGHSF